jgi:FkbM family methyltransferase
MAYKDGEKMRLEEIKNLGINPTAILDVGAHTGQFYNWAKPVWPDSVIWMIEANPLHENKLKAITDNTRDEYMIAALGDEEREVTFYTRVDKPFTEGNSYYEETGFWDIQHLVKKDKVTLQTLDDLFTDDTTFELIKLDTQGSELDILKGGKNLCQKASAIILEISYIEYNIGAPSKEDLISYMESIGFEKKMSVGEHYDNDNDRETFGQVIQKDLVFVNKNL